ncbi:hypothetical protein BXZ70DRAFT_1008645 [Cristinia sonorae]|uniref:Protein kinase domain-containing protein n=1 Tax=Cristinia sonorae TaxID=1940300 RepID=A0A8K0UMN8_9AGAR|nr:hypothetical protein BXZ70DRAFT_1008645 [Cristinia sonorae]
MFQRELRPDERAVLLERGWQQQRVAEFSRRGNVWWFVDPVTTSSYIVKAVEKGDRELSILPWLLNQPTLSSVILPAEIIECKNSSLIVTPGLSSVARIVHALGDRRLVERTVDAFLRLVECVEIFHQNNIAHMDIDLENFVFADTDICCGPHTFKKDSFYLIDFGATRRFDSGPGTNIVIDDFREAGGHYPPPEGMDAVEPFAYDIFSLGKALITWWDIVQCFREDVDLPRSAVDAFIQERLLCRDPLQRARIEDVKREWLHLAHLAKTAPRISPPPPVPAAADGSISEHVVVS